MDKKSEYDEGYDKGYLDGAFDAIKKQKETTDKLNEEIRIIEREYQASHKQINGEMKKVDKELQELFEEDTRRREVWEKQSREEMIKKNDEKYNIYKIIENMLVCISECQAK